MKVAVTCDVCIICGHFLRDDSKPCKECNGGVAHKKRSRGKVPWTNKDYAAYERQRAAREGFGE
jgi:hypothetical protein